ncbi:MAG: hypothetical protein GC200_07395 [Tepidisphaera sp.]|nr:hypothetical protein [Tepidisphaera sp.]
MSGREVTLIAWNILHGGGPQRTPWIGLALIDHAPDIVMLCEFRPGRGSQLRAQLADAGLVHQRVSDVEPTRNGILIASRFDLREAGNDAREAESACAGRLLTAIAAGVLVVGVHVPDDNELGKKAGFFHQLTALARKNRDLPCVILGDFNTQRRGLDADGRAFRLESKLGVLASLGYADAWRKKHPGEREDSWVSAHASGRLDGAYLSAPLAHALIDARYEHAPRGAGLSDHSMLVLKLALEPREEGAKSPRGLFGGAEGRAG